MSAPDPLSALLALVRDAAREGAALALAAERASVTTSVTGLVSKAQLATAFGVSSTTIDRFVGEAMPFEQVGGRRRFDVASCREWLTGRGKRGARVKVVTTDDIDVADVLSRNGLRVVGGAR